MEIGRLKEASLVRKVREEDPAPATEIEYSRVGRQPSQSNDNLQLRPEDEPGDQPALQIRWDSHLVRNILAEGCTVISVGAVYGVNALIRLGVFEAGGLSG